MRIFVAITIALAVCLSVAGPVPAQSPADNPTLTVPQLPPVESPAPDSPRPAPEPSTALPVPQPAASVYDDSRFWIVSSRRCGQHRCNLGCCEFDCFEMHCEYCDGGCVPRMVIPTSEAAITAELEPNIPTCIVVHGSFVNWNTLQEYGCRIHGWLRQADPNRPLQMIFYTWPSEGITYVPPIDINILGKRSALNGIYLTRVIALVPPQSRVSLMGHSHGARTVAAALHLLGGGAVEGFVLTPGADSGHRIRTVLMASAIDHDWLNPGERYGLGLCRTEALLSLNNRRDFALKFYPLRRPFSSRALSQCGFTESDLCRMGGLAERICEMEVSRIVGHGHTWQYFYHHPELATAISPYIYYSDDSVQTTAPVLQETVP